MKRWLNKQKKRFTDEEFRIKFLTFIVIKSLIIFFIIALILKNKEFIYYDLILLLVVLLTYFIHKKLKIHLPLLIMIWIIFLIHAGGGVLYINGTRLYDITFSFIKYGMIVHFFGIFVSVFVIYNLIHNLFGEKEKYSNTQMIFILSFMAMGFGTIVEMIELFAVVFLNAAEGVGGYMNNAIDLLVNGLGALTGAIIITHYHYKKNFKNIIFKGKLKSS